MTLLSLVTESATQQPSSATGYLPRLLDEHAVRNENGITTMWYVVGAGTCHRPAMCTDRIPLQCCGEPTSKYRTKTTVSFCSDIRGIIFNTLLLRADSIPKLAHKLLSRPPTTKTLPKIHNTISYCPANDISTTRYMTIALLYSGNVVSRKMTAEGGSGFEPQLGQSF
jgi:hypothetical protein